MIRIISIAFNRPDLLELQVRAFVKFCTDSFEFVVVNNGRTPADREAVDQRAEWIGVRHVRTHHTHPGEAGLSHQRAMEFAWHLLGKTYTNAVLFLDHDAFPYQRFTMADLLSAGSCCGVAGALAGVRQGRGKASYPWPGLLAMDIPHLPDIEQIDFAGGEVEGQRTDSRGNLHYYLTAHPAVQVGWLHTTTHVVRQDQLLGVPKDFPQYNLAWGFEFIHGAFVHYGRAANWDYMPSEYMAAKDAALDTFLEGRLA